MNQAELKASDPLPCPFTVVVDTREQSPWGFGGLRADACDNNRPLLVKTIRETLSTGDYSIQGYADRVTIERKSIEDLWGTVAGGRERFKREHERMREMIDAGGFACVVIEEEMIRGITQPPLWANMQPKIVFRTFLRWSMRYRVPWYWAGSRAFAEVLGFRLLSAWYEHEQEAT